MPERHERGHTCAACARRASQQKRDQRHAPAFAVVVGAHDQHDVLHRHDVMIVQKMSEITP